MEKLKQESITIDVIVTSPPYNINKEYRSYHDNKDRREYLNWLYDVAQKSISILKDDGSFFLNVGGTPSDSLLPFEVANEFRRAGYHLQNTIHWIKAISFEKNDVGKANGSRHDFAIGHFKPITSDRFLTDTHEYIFHFTKTGNSKLDKLAIGVPYQDKTNIGRWKSANQDKRDRGNTWFIPYPTITEERPHPAVFPEKLPYLCMKLHGIMEGTVVYDPFMGIGTTALACLFIPNVNYLGTEIDGQYIKIARENIDERKKMLKKNEGRITKIVDWLDEDDVLIGSE